MWRLSCLAGATAKTPVEGQGFLKPAEAVTLSRTKVTALGSDWLIEGYPATEGEAIIMFTGIIEEMGTIENIAKGAHSAVLTINARKILEDVHIGDSIAVNGVCLTVTSFDHERFTADVMHETLNRSALAQCKKKKSCESGTCNVGKRTL